VPVSGERPQHRFLIAPNNLAQTGLGIRGKEESSCLAGSLCSTLRRASIPSPTSLPTRQPPTPAVRRYGNSHRINPHRNRIEQVKYTVDPVNKIAHKQTRGAPPRMIG
jgi:hypothetical protein